jgi:calcineurin-like phosphoesterase family protein
MRQHFIADMHFGSPFRSYAKPRGFTSVEAMHDAIRDAWKGRVAPEDMVWVLGDIGDVELLRDLPGTKRLIFGNDDRPKTPIRQSGIFETCADSHVLETNWKPILLIHRPEDAEPGEMPVLHGHTHAMPDQPDPRFVCVSVDKTGWGPIELDEAIQRLRARGSER